VSFWRELLPRIGNEYETDDCHPVVFAVVAGLAVVIVTAILAIAAYGWIL